MNKSINNIFNEVKWRSVSATVRKKKGRPKEVLVADIGRPIIQALWMDYRNVVRVVAKSISLIRSKDLIDSMGSVSHYTSLRCTSLQCITSHALFSTVVFRPTVVSKLISYSSNSSLHTKNALARNHLSFILWPLMTWIIVNSLIFLNQKNWNEISNVWKRFPIQYCRYRLLQLSHLRN